MDKLLLLGINHKVAPVALRERLALNADGVIRSIQKLSTRLPEEAEVALLSTCNRTELVLSIGDTCEAEEIGRQFIGEIGCLPGDSLSDVLYIYRGSAAAQHLLRVATGLDSLVVGENEIQGQVRTAANLAQTAGTSGPTLDKLFRLAVECGKRVRSETEIGKTKLSVATLVVELTKDRLGSLQQHTALLIGAGKISTLTARELVRAGLHCVLVANRTFERAQKLAQNLGKDCASAVHFDQLNKRLVEADIVICSTGAPHIVLHKKAVEKTMECRSDRPMLVVDLAIPRDADPAIGNLLNVELYTIDDLSGLVQERYPLTARALGEAEIIIKETLSDLQNWRETRRAAPLIRSLRAKADAIVQTEVERTLRRLGPLTPDQQAAIDYLGQAIVNKLLHEPTICLKNQPEIIQQSETLELVQALFGLEQTPNTS